MIQLLAGDCRDILPTLAANSVQTVVTSPPYYGLRDYGTALWDGGDANCQHTFARQDTRLMLGSNGTLGKNCTSWTHRDATPPRQCSCGATRIDRQIGLEATPDEYLATMVAVFREVRRVLRPDGTCFVNMGDSYASGGKRPSQFPSPARVLACDSGGTGPSGYSAPDYACLDLCDGCRGALLQRSDGTFQPQPRLPQHALMTGRDSERLGGAPLTQGVAPLNVLVSTNLEFSAPPRALCSHCANCGACLSVLRSSSRDARECVRSSCLNIPMLSHEPKPKDLLMMPARLALALQADGWWLRSAITWCKPSPMPESCTDRPTSATEMVYLLTKRAHYFYDSIAIREDAVSDHPSGNGYKREPRLTYADGNGARGNDTQWSGVGGTRNARNWWVINSKPFPQAHFAAYPPELAERCIRAGTRPGDTVLDPFAGAGTTLLVADRLQRDAIGIELSPDYTRMAMQRCQDDAPLFTSFPPAETDAQDERMRDLFRDAAD